jgi:hypothetical protein
LVISAKKDMTQQTRNGLERAEEETSISHLRRKWVIFG